MFPVKYYRVNLEICIAGTLSTAKMLKSHFNVSVLQDIVASAVETVSILITFVH